MLKSFCLKIGVTQINFSQIFICALFFFMVLSLVSCRSSRSKSKMDKASGNPVYYTPQFPFDENGTYRADLVRRAR